MDNTLKYKGYIGQFSYEEGDDAFHGTVLNLRDVIHFQGRSIDELRQSLVDSVEDYLAWCAAEGRPPEKPFTGKFIVRVPPELHRKVNAHAQAEGVSLNQWIADALEKAVESPGG
jgi:predicted HicB family RNase H-like nuclease